MLISSLHNVRIKQIRALRDRKERERTGLFFVEGIRAVVEAIKLRAPIDLLVVAPQFLTNPWIRGLVDERRAVGMPCLEVTAEVFQSMTYKDGRQGVAAVVQQRWEPLNRLQLGNELCWIALDSVQYPGNLGTILRTTDAVGGAGVILLENATDPHDPVAVRASMGAMPNASERIRAWPAVRASMGAILSQRLIRTTFVEFATWKRRQGAVVVGTSSDAPIDYRAIAYNAPVVLLMGCERLGLSREGQAVCDVVVKIPMQGRSDSLNLAIATGLLLYEVFRQHYPVPGRDQD